MIISGVDSRSFPSSSDCTLITRAACGCVPRAPSAFVGPTALIAIATQPPEGLLIDVRAATMTPLGPVVSAVMSRDGKLVAIVAPAGRVSLRDAATLGERWSAELGAEVWRKPRFLRDDRLFVATERRGVLLETASGKRLVDGPYAPLETDSEARAVLSRTGRYLGLLRPAGGAIEAQAIEVASGRTVARMRAGKGGAPGGGELP